MNLGRFMSLNFIAILFLCLVYSAGLTGSSVQAALENTVVADQESVTADFSASEMTMTQKTPAISKIQSIAVTTMSSVRSSVSYSQTHMSRRVGGSFTLVLLLLLLSAGFLRHIQYRNHSVLSQVFSVGHRVVLFLHGKDGHKPCLN